MENSSELTLMIILTIGAGVTAQVVANYLKLPSIVFLLVFGVLIGNSGLRWVRPQELGPGLEVIVSLSVSLILFEGGLNLQLQDLGKVSGSLRNLVTVGALITLIGGGIAAHYLSEFPWQLAFLYASLVVVTGPTVISPLLKNVGVDKRLSTILEGEGVLIDALGAILAVCVLNILLNRDSSAIEVTEGLVTRLGIGGAIGIVGGWALGEFLKKSHFLVDELKTSVVLAALLALSALAQSLQSESGLTTAVLAGIMVRAASIPDERLLIRFKGQLTLLTISVLFILLAANLSIPSIFALGWGGVLTVLALMFVVRPISIIFCTWNSTLNWRQKSFLAWCAPRGIVAASVASLFSILLTERGINGGEAIKAQVFLTIIMTVFLQGLTARWIAALLRLNDPELSGLVIVGGNEIGLLLARLYKDRGQKVALIDTNAEFCRRATAVNIPAFVSNGLDINTLNSAGLDSVGTFIALTVNTDVNLVLAQRALEEFRPSRVYAVYAREGGNYQEILQAFGNRVPIKAWNQYMNQRETRLGEVILEAGDIERQLMQFNILYGGGSVLPLLFERGNRLQIVPANITWERGDRIIYLLHKPNLLPPTTTEINTAPDPIDLDNTTIEVQSETLPRSEQEQNYLNMARDILQKVRPSVKER